MPTVREISLALIGSWRLLSGDRGALAFFERDSAAAIRSFFAALIVLPAYLVLVTLRLWDDLGSVSFLRLLVVELIAYTINWTAYAVVMEELSRFLDCSERYPAFLTVYNWSSVLQMAFYLPATLLAQSGLLPPAAEELVMFAVTFGLLAYQWILTRYTLELQTITAAGLVLLDLILSVFISGAADGML